MRVGFVSIIGLPNVGKSTLLNSILGEKLAIVSRKPQTTRNIIRGIKNLPDAQLIFLDTPGFYKGDTVLNQAMLRNALSAMKDVDVIIHMIETGRSPIPLDIESREKHIIEELRKTTSPCLLAINKVDALKDKRFLLPLMEKFHSSGLYKSVIPISALKNEGLDILLDSVIDLCPEGERLFPEDMMTEETERFFVQEIVREKIIESTYQEIPYACAVVVESFEERPDKNLVSINAVIYVEKTSQKGIVIGKGGAMLKRSGTQARKEIESLLGKRVYLDLRVKVREGWSNDMKSIKEFGYF